MLDIKGQVCVLQDEHISIQDTIYEVADILSSQRKDIEQMERRHIPDHVRNCQVDVLKDWKQEDIVFYEGTRVYDAALNMMENKKYLTFIGGPGSGKTATARHIALQLGKAGAEIVPVCGPEEVLLYGKSSINQVFILDDILGIFAVDITMLNNIIRHQERLLKLLGNQSKLIFTCRKTVYKEALKFDSFITKNIVDLHGGDFDLSEEEKMKMLAQHCNKAGIDSSVYNTLSFNSAEIMFPFVCKLFAKDKTCHKFGSRFFNKPFECLINQMEILQGTNPTQYTAMVLCLVNENKISLQSLPDNNVKEDIYNCCGLNRSTSDRQIIDALKQITGTFVSEVNNEFTFIHDSIYEIVAFHFGTDHVTHILKYMPSHFVANKLIVCGESTFDNLKIKLSKIYFPLLADRMYSDIKDMHLFDVFRNTSLNNIQFLYVFINFFKQIPYCEFKLRILFRSPFDPRYVMKNVTREDENQEKDDDLIYDELTRQELLMDKHIFYGDKWKHCCHIHSTISWIVYYGHMHLLLEIVEHVQSQDESSDLVFGTNLEERSRMLKLGCYSGNADIVELMLQYIDEESVNSSPLYKEDEFVDENFHRKQTPLTAACHFGYTNIADILIKYGADVNLQDRNFESPLYVAIGQGHCDIVKCLLSYNVRTWDIFIPDDVNITNTAVDLAEMCGKENIVDLLMQFDEEDNYTF
ncbi:uncharacterized protein LOC127716457 [Mytilus californianus]|uniref:uncharacterized protein LOC127716457 n=1 Tax=Mytilus californianus TaxID=6549 RepID=UPI0022457536|nr:uncharacterized protein LOC127716457 [Mytilus californianus]